MVTGIHNVMYDILLAITCTLILYFWIHEFHENCHSVIFYFMKKKTPNDAVTPQRQSQFTPKMKANAVSRLLSSLVWIDQYNRSSTALIISGKMHFPLISDSFSWTKCDVKTSFMDFKYNSFSDGFFQEITWRNDKFNEFHKY